MSFNIGARNLAEVNGFEFWAGPGVRVVAIITDGDGTCCGDPGKARRGVQLDFPNGFTLSAMWGTVNYCSASHIVHTLESPDAEVAILNRDGRVLGSPTASMTPEDFLALVPVVAGFGPGRPITSPEEMLSYMRERIARLAQV